MSILSLSDWLETPQGQYLLQWESARFDVMVADIFGYNAVQIGLPEHEFLRGNRMPFRFRCARLGEAEVMSNAEALPFATATLDLVLLPHVLEFSPNPHQVLREVERVLVPEGSVIISGFNPFSLWGLRRLLARGDGAFPWRGQYLSVRRTKDWLALLGFETQSGSFGCYAPAVTSGKWLERWRFIDKAGDRWWPIFGGTYIIQGIKRVQGMRLITPNWRDRRAAAKRLSPVAQRGRQVTGGVQKTK
ncbi:class I SAM-dependent methyltransferase [Aromatoleum bremense]|uniref:Methyltransferase domain-containing protein n=1 Tax=Aromatoleum bremense TaxID=76115 RepID=A0ABX1NR44_9RHOO|nr:class I SAM-dependent methyltransferase [Aromatoleum bremense]NMG14182.1 methyltransferase domain-containing protein [Aromatoleum bremense]QTQ33963.1 SAM-dependent methyltransferase [Aromatoleum bremense]